MKVIKESTLTEKNWKYKLDPILCKVLRTAISDENYDDLKRFLQVTWSTIHDLVPEALDEDDLNSIIEDIEWLDTEPDEEIDVSQEDIEDNFNYELDKLYDFYDDMSIWISL